MRITPLDVRKQDFRKAVRGFDCDEVRAFMSTLADEYETVLVDNKQLRETIDAQESKLREYQTIEGTLRDTLMTAQKVTEDTKDNARRKGELIVQEAEQQSRQILEECRQRTEELRREIVMLRKEKEAYLARFRTLAQAQIQFVDTHESDFEDLDKRLIEIADAVVGNIGTRIGTTPIVHHAPATAAAPQTHAPAPAAAPAAHSAPAVPPAAPGRPEVDVWRDYRPKSAEDLAAPAPEAAPAEEIVRAVAEVNDPEPVDQALANLDRAAASDAADRQDQAPEQDRAQILDQAAQMAATGIPVPAIDPFKQGWTAPVGEAAEDETAVPV